MGNPGALVGRTQRPRPQPISGTPPPVPPSRPYTVSGNKKIAFPQSRVMGQSFSDEGTSSDVVLMKGETVIVIGNSPRRGYLIVEKRNHTIHVPYTLLALK